MTTDPEKRVLGSLADAWKAFLDLPQQHVDEQDEFRTAIHQAQDIIAVRVARRADPATWPTHRAPETLHT